MAKVTHHEFRTIFESILKSLNLDGLGFKPSSLRRGGATCAYDNGMSFEKLVTKGRWQHLQTARIYIDAASQALASFSMPHNARAKVLSAKKFFLSQVGARGRAATREFLGSKSGSRGTA